MYSEQVQFYPAPSSRYLAEVQISAHGLQLSWEQERAIWPFEALQLDWGGSETALLEIRYQDQILYAKGLNLLEAMAPHLPSAQAPVLAKIRKQARPGKWFKGFALLGVASLATSLLLVWGSWQGLLWSQNYALKQIPVSWEQELGKQAYQEMLAETPVCQSELLQQGVNDIAQRLQASIPDSPYTLTYQVVRSELVNAFALPGGQIAIHAALLAEVPSLAALAGVMAHEAEHVLQQHGLKGLLSKMGLGLVTLLIFGDMGTVMLTLGGAGIGLLGLSFSRSQEAEADLGGLKLLHAAGFDPAGMQDFFGWMAARQAEGANLPAFLSTHPLSEQRLEQIRLASQELKPLTAQALQTDFSALQAAAKDCLKDK